MKKTVVVADDHPIFRKGLIEILSEIKDLEIVAEVADGLTAYQQIISKRPDIAILDIEMPGLSGLDVCTKVLKEKSDTKFILLTMHREKDFYNNAMDLGVMGYLLKDNAITELMLCVEKALKGEKFISPGIEKFLITRKGENDIPELQLLTATEKIILKLIAESKTTQEIAGLLFVSPNTIDNHRSNIVKKIGLEGKNSLLKFAIQSKNSL